MYYIGKHRVTMIIFVWFALFAGVIGSSLPQGAEKVRSFIGDDSVMNYLFESDPLEFENESFDRQFHAQLSHRFRQFDDPKLESYSWEELDIQLQGLHDGLEATYLRLLRFSDTLFRMSDEELRLMGERLVADPNYVERIGNDEDWSSLTDEMVVSSTKAMEDTVIGFEEKEDVVEAAMDSYWKLRHKVKYRVNKAAMISKALLKFVAYKKIIRSKRIIIVMKIIVLVEKIKKCLKALKRWILYKISTILHDAPYVAYHTTKILTRFTIKVMLQILWEVKFLVAEIGYKTYFLLKRLEQVPMILLHYLKKDIMKTTSLLFRLKRKLGKDEDTKRREGWQEEIYDDADFDYDFDLLNVGFTDDIMYDKNQRGQYFGEIEELVTNFVPDKEWSTDYDNQPFNFDFEYVDSITAESLSLNENLEIVMDFDEPDEEIKFNPLEFS